MEEVNSNPELQVAPKLSIESIKAHVGLGIAGIIANTISLIFGGLSLLLILPKLAMLQKELDIQSTTNTTQVILMIIIILAFLLLTLSILLVAKKITNVTLATGVLLTSGISFFILLGLFIVAMISPIYGIAASIGDAPNNQTPQVVACTMDAKMCPDGSYVGRSGPKCEFVCPNASSK